jgi:hypothetical protein
MQASGSLSREKANVHLNDGGARNFVARMERSEIRGSVDAVRESRIALRSIRATWLRFARNDAGNRRAASN